MEDYKFQIGDKVRMINTNPSCGRGSVEVGDIGVIKEIFTGFTYRYRIDFNSQRDWKGLPGDLELIESEPTFSTLLYNLDILENKLNLVK